MKNGFLIISFLIYLGFYAIFFGILFYFSLFFVQLVSELQTKSRAFYAYHTIQKKFKDDCIACTDVHIYNVKLKLISLNNIITWKMRDSSLIRRERRQKENASQKGTIYFCTMTKDFMPFMNQKVTSFCTGFTIKLFSHPFTILAFGKKGDISETP